MIKDALKDYFSKLLVGDERAEAKLSWRLSCFESGLRYLSFIESHYFPINGKNVLDVAAGWGGHAVALASAGARVVAADLNDHAFAGFRGFNAENSLCIDPVCANCEKLPFSDSSFDALLALDVVEHIDSIEAFATEVARVLRPGGVCLVSTPSRIRSLIEGEPHYHLRGLTLLPFALQGIVAKRIFHREYPFQITRQYLYAKSVAKPFNQAGLRATPISTGRIGNKLNNIPLLGPTYRQLLWNFIAIEK